MPMDIGLRAHQPQPGVNAIAVEDLDTNGMSDRTLAQEILKEVTVSIKLSALAGHLEPLKFMTQQTAPPQRQQPNDLFGLWGEAA